MSQIKLNLIDSQTILSGTVPGAVGDRCVAALSAEPETIPELEAALARFEKCPPAFGKPNFSSLSSVDPEPFDAGILIIDLAARIVACDSTYSQPGPEGYVEYHDGTGCTDLKILYRLFDDWLFVNSLDMYDGLHEERQKLRTTPPLDARAIMYGLPLVEFIATNVKQSQDIQIAQTKKDADAVAETVRDVHRRWLLTTREDLLGQSPRDLLFARRDLIESDLESRCFQWEMQLEGPPCLDRNSFAYRYGGFGIHEWVLYYDLLRHLIWKAVDMQISALESNSSVSETELITTLEECKSNWLNEPNAELDNRTPITIIDNERRRLPEAMGGRSMVIDENCPICKMMGDEAEAGLGIYFWHLDGCNMDDEFVFSGFRTIEEYETDRSEMEEHHKEFDRRMKEGKERIARGEVVKPDPWFDPPELEELVPWPIREPEPPEA